MNVFDVGFIIISIITIKLVWDLLQEIHQE